MQRTEPHNDILPLSEIPLRAAYPLRQEPVSHRYELVSQLKSNREIKRTHTKNDGITLKKSKKDENYHIFYYLCIWQKPTKKQRNKHERQ